MADAAEFETLLFSITDGVAELTLNRPDKLNAFCLPMHADLREVLTRVESDEAIRCLLITGAGRGFCSGQDLSERRMSDTTKRVNLGESLAERFNPLITRILTLPKPVVCAVNGAAAGAGMSLALAGDIVLAGRSAKFLQAFARIGLVPDAGSTYLLPRLVGRARAMGLAMLAEPIDGATAADWGLVWKVLDDDALMPEARALAARLAKAPPLSIAGIKQAISASPENDLATQLALEAELQGKCGFTDDYQEGIAAFLEKRPARFKGR